MSARSRWFVVSTVLMGCVGGAYAESRPLVVELFTSQGCSSCPPAEAYVGSLSTRPDILTLAFHVNYWDDLGWRDRFALPQSVERQNNYARNLHRASVYTPQIVIDGREDDLRSSARTITKALSGTRDGVPLSINLQDATLVVDVGAQPGASASELVLVAYLRHAVSTIGLGENAGRTLEEFNIVRGVRTLGLWTGKAAMFCVLVSTLPRDATDVAVLLQPRGQGAIIGAAARALY
jgi:hypothetical protein